MLARCRPGGGGGAGRVGLAAGGPGRVLRRRPVAAHPRQPRAGRRRRPRHRRAAGPLPRRGDPGDQPYGAGAAGGAGVSGAAAAAARRARRARRRPTAELAASSPAVALFVDRARAARPGFALTESNAAAVAEICRRLDGLPLAIELAAARTRLLDPNALLGRLAKSLDALGTGAVDLPERQRTLRATVEWSVELLDDAERSLLEIAAVFVDGWTAEAGRPGSRPGRGRGAGPARGPGPAQPDLPRPGRRRPPAADAGDRSARSWPSGWRPDPTPPRSTAATPTCYRALAERADRPLRGAGHDEWLERLESEAGNLAAAVRWYLDHDTVPLPHLFRVLWLFWELRDHLGEARAWVGAAPAGRGLPRPSGPGRAAVDGGGDRRRGGRRPDGADGPRAPGAAARRDRGPLSPRGVPAGPGLDLGDRRRLRRRPTPGARSPWSSSAARTSRSGQRWPPTAPASWR